MTISELSAGVRLAAWVAGRAPWKRIVPTLAARLFGAISLRLVDGVSSPLYYGPNRQFAYHLTQIWIANATRLDAKNARATIVWKRRSGREMDSRSVYGLWYPKVATGLLTPAARPVEEVDLPSNSATAHLGLMVRSQSNKAYLVCTATYNDFGAWKNYAHAPYELSSGSYDVDVLIEAAGGMVGYLKLDVQWPGGNSDPLITTR
jgi:hypothetical protein